MKTATLIHNEELRLLDLHAYDILDSKSEKDYDELVQLAAQICQRPFSLISFVDADRQWFKSKIGINETETSRSSAFCAHTILSGHGMVVENAEMDERFSRNPFVTGEMNIRFYAGVPIVSPTGQRLGAVCVMDSKPGKLSEEQLSALSIIAKQITRLLELRAKNKLLRGRAVQLLELKSSALHAAIIEKDKSDQAIAYELHEQVAQKIAAIKLYMEMSESYSALRADYVEEGKKLLSEVLNDIRKLSNSILPSNLTSMPIKSLLNDFVEHARKIYSFRIEILTTDNVNDLNFENSVTCLRIVEKWLAELALRKNVNNVMISFKLDQQIHLRITDDSRELESSDMEECIVKSMVYSRAKIAGGTASYVSTANLDNVLSVVI